MLTGSDRERPGADGAGDAGHRRPEDAAPVLVADIGGTHARFALGVAGADGRPGIEAVDEFEVAGFPSLAEAAAHYLATTRPGRLRQACFAVASAVTGDEIRITNNAWSFSIARLQRQLGLQVQVLNDFAAVGLAVPHLRQEQLQPLGAAVPAAGRPGGRHFAALGPGTGLGVCRMLREADRTLVLETEGGHAGFSPGDAYELAILQHLLRSYPRVSFERVLSGPGLCNLYKAVCAVEGLQPEPVTPELVTARALQDGETGASGKTIQLFCAMLGSFAGDVVLMHGAWDGVYLGGGLTVRLLPWLAAGAFRRRFEAKGRFQELLQAVPTQAITYRNPGLLGASARALGY